MKLSELPNIGVQGQKELEEAGIMTPDDLLAVGAEAAWLKMRSNDPGVCLHQLYALEGAILGIPKKDIPPRRKEDLKRFFKAEQ